MTWPRPGRIEWAALACVGVLAVLGMRHGMPFLSGVDLGVHEFGHLVTGWLPAVVTAAAGSVAQVAAPLGLAAYFGLVRNERAAAGVIVAWAATSLTNVATYVADARAQELDLFGGEDAVHDWAFLLGPEHCACLGKAAPLANFLRAAAWLLILAGALLAVWRLPARTSGVVSRPPDGRPPGC